MTFSTVSSEVGAGIYGYGFENPAINSTETESFAIQGQGHGFGNPLLINEVLGAVNQFLIPQTEGDELCGGLVIMALPRDGLIYSLSSVEETYRAWFSDETWCFNQAVRQCHTLIRNPDHNWTGNIPLKELCDDDTMRYGAIRLKAKQLRNPWSKGQAYDQVIVAFDGRNEIQNCIFALAIARILPKILMANKVKFSLPRDIAYDPVWRNVIRFYNERFGFKM